MNNSTIIEWLNENEFRSYPLLESSTQFVTTGQVTLDVHAFILDAMLFYSSAPSNPVIETISTNSTNLTITVTGQANFVIPSYITATYPYYVRNSNHSLLVVGDASGIPTNLTFTVNTGFEISTVIEIYPNTLGLSSLTVDGNLFTGDITLADGYQCSLIPNGATLDIEIGRGEGQPLPCISVKGITNDCNSIVSVVNGVSPINTGGTIKILAGNHTKVIDDPDNNRIFIGYDFSATQVLSSPLPPPPTII